MIKGHLSPLMPAPLGPDFQLSSEWFRIPRACEYTQLPQSTIYEIIDDPDNQIVTFTLKLRKGQRRGIRFIWRPSLDAFLNQPGTRGWRRSQSDYGGLETNDPIVPKP